MDKDHNHKILLVEDDNTLRKVLKDELEERGYEVVTAVTGEQIFSTLSGFTPEIILLDIVMDDMDGFEALTLLKTNNQYKDIPVIIITVLSNKDDVERGLSLGAADYVIKSQNAMDDIVTKVENIVK